MKILKQPLPILLCSTFILSLFFTTFLSGQAASSLFPDITEFKLEYPLDPGGNDYEGVSYNDRDDPHIKNEIEESLGGFIASSPYNEYFFVSGNELVMRAHCAGALTSVNSYPRCELRQQIGGENTFWDYSDEHELNVTLRIMELPDLKQEVCVVQAKGTDTPSTTSGTEEALRVEYRQDGSSGWHLEVNESNGPSNVLNYTLGQTVHIRVYIDDDHIFLEMENLDTGDTYDYDFQSDYSHGYFKTGAYTQSSIWGEKNGIGDEDPDARSEVRFSQLELGTPTGGPTCTAQVPGNRNTNNVGQSTATLSWSSVPDVQDYDLQYRPTGSSSWTTNNNNQNTSVNISGLSNSTQYEWQVKSVCADGAGTNYSDGSGPNFTTSGSSGNTFTPDPNKIYHINVPVHNLRLAATGESENAYTTSSSTTGNDVEWKFVAKGNGYWHVQRADGGSKPRLRTDNSLNADMQETSSSGTYTYYEFAEGSSSGTWFMTLPNGPSNYKRLQVNSSGNVLFKPTSSASTWESFTFTEVSSNNGVFVPDPNKTYHINVPVHNLRVASTGASEDPYTTSTSTTGDDVEWKFVAKGNGYWHVQRADGGSKPRLRSNNSIDADMQATSSSGGWTYYEFTEGSSSSTWYMTLPDGPTNYKRMQVNSAGDVKFKPTSSAGTWESFTFEEVSAGGGCTTASVPSNRQVNSVTNASAVVSWSSTGADNYDVRYKKVSDSDWKYNNNNSGTSSTITGIVESTTYEWQVRSQCSNGSASTWSSGQGPDFTTANNFKKGNVISSRSAGSNGSLFPSEVSVYPNPARNEITLAGTLNGESIQILNVNGQVVMETKDKRILIENLQKGIYFVKSQNRAVVRFFKL